MRYLILILTLQLTIASVSYAKGSFVCTVSDKDSSILLTPPSEAETYMNDGQFHGLEFNTMKNEDGVSYSVIVVKNSDLIVSTTIPFYPDTNLIFKYKSHMIRVFCTK